MIGAYVRSDRAMSLEDRWKSLVLRCSQLCNRAPSNFAVYSSPRSLQQQLQVSRLRAKP